MQSFSAFYNTKVPGIRMGVFVHVDTAPPVPAVEPRYRLTEQAMRW